MLRVKELVYLFIINVIILQSSESGSQKCKTINTYSHRYRDFFPLANESDEWTDVHLEFSVSASSNARILLSELKHPSLTDPVYEIVLGGVDNTFSELRRQQLVDTKASAETPNILSPIEMRTFWIAVYSDGRVEAGRNSTTFLSWQDPSPIHVRYFSFSTWAGVYGKWSYNCPKNQTDDGKKEDQSLTPKERLRRDLFNTMDTIQEPVFDDVYDDMYLSSVYWNIRRIALNVENSELSVTGLACMEWKDDRLYWEPNDYDGIDELNVESYELWKPDFVLFNPIEHRSSKPFTSDGSVLLKANGYVSWVPRMDIHATCDLDFQYWPWDEHICKIKFGTWSQRSLYINVDKVIDQDFISDWNVTDISSDYQSTEELKVMNTESHYSRAETDHIGYEIHFTLKRNTSFYHNLLFYLFIVGSLLLLIAVCLSPFSTRKVALNCFCTLFTTILLILTTNSLPEFTKQTPPIVMAYSVILMTSLFYGSVSIFLIALTRMKHESLPPKIFVTILDNAVISVLFFIPNEPVQDDGKYHTFMENNGNIHSNVQPTSKEKQKILLYWLKLATAIDHIIFAFILFIVLLLINSFPAPVKPSEEYQFEPM